MEGSFESMVEAVRVGYLTARDAGIHRKWLRRRAAPARGSALSGSALEQAIGRIAGMFPDNVIRVSA